MMVGMEVGKEVGKAIASCLSSWVAAETAELTWSYKVLLGTPYASAALRIDIFSSRMATTAFSRSCFVHDLDPDGFFAISALWKSMREISEGHAHR